MKLTQTPWNSHFYWCDSFLGDAYAYSGTSCFLYLSFTFPNSSSCEGSLVKPFKIFGTSTFNDERLWRFHNCFLGVSYSKQPTSEMCKHSCVSSVSTSVGCIKWVFYCSWLVNVRLVLSLILSWEYIKLGKPIPWRAVYANFTVLQQTRFSFLHGCY